MTERPGAGGGDAGCNVVSLTDWRHRAALRIAGERREAAAQATARRIAEFFGDEPRPPRPAA